MRFDCGFSLLIILASPLSAAQPFLDRTHDSKVFHEPRHYRIVLPPTYDASNRAYPVIYYFHGHSDRYTLEHYDGGKDTIPKIVDYVAGHDVIVVSVDGFVARDYTSFYGGAPWDVGEDGGDMDFGAYFLELVDHVDHSFRTLTDRRHRATSGLSMGGFMSLYLSARYPQMIGSASAFNPGPEFFTGDKGRRMLWRPKDHVSSHATTMIRLIRASGDYISQYHEETRDAYARTPEVNFEYRQDEYHRHWATSIAETFAFHQRAFENSALDNVPEAWSYTSAYRSFSAWGWDFETEGEEPGYTYLEAAGQQGFRVVTRRWAPDGPPVKDRKIHVTTGPLYKAGATYSVSDYNLSTGKTTRINLVADARGRLQLVVTGSGHQVSFRGPGAGGHAPLLLPVTRADFVRIWPEAAPHIPIRVYNPRTERMAGVKVTLSSEYPTVQIASGSYTIPEIGPGEAVDITPRLQLRFTGGGRYFARARLLVTMTYDEWHTASASVDVLIAPERIAAPAGMEILDGRTVRLNVFRQKGNQGGGASVERLITEGKGNGNGILEPGEEATVWVRLEQGLDAFDKHNWYRAKVYSPSPFVSETADIQEQKQREWTGAKERTSLIRLDGAAPTGAVIPLFLDNESWSFHYTPDVRYGSEKLYQAFQLHTRHLHLYELRIR